MLRAGIAVELLAGLRIAHKNVHRPRMTTISNIWGGRERDAVRHNRVQLVRRALGVSAPETRREQGQSGHENAGKDEGGNNKTGGVAAGMHI